MTIYEWHQTRRIARVLRAECPDIALAVGLAWDAVMGERS